jgi:glycosyltransferase involved in cell wall biosynthesis
MSVARQPAMTARSLTPTMPTESGRQIPAPTPTALPLVSVVIPCYNQAQFLGDAIQSVLAQSYRHVEVIVVNDGSNDDTAAVVATFPSVRYLCHENQGLAAARNTGLAHCRGQLLVFLDADDRLLPEAIKTGVTLLMADPRLGFVAGHSQYITRGGVPLPTRQPVRSSGDPYLALLRRNSIRNPAMVMFRAPVLGDVGGFNSRFDACADYEMYLRISRRYAVGFHDAVVAEYRKHGENMSLDAALMLRQLLHVMRLQRPHIVDAARRDAFHAGVRNVRCFYGDRLATQLRARFRTRFCCQETLTDLATLIRCHPYGALEHGRRKLMRWWRSAQTKVQPT